MCLFRHQDLPGTPARRSQTCWPINVLTTDLTKARRNPGIARGPYGRCVYKCDNDVVDHQVVNMQFANGRRAAMTMTAFAEGGRRTRIFGARRTGERLGVVDLPGFPDRCHRDDSD